MTWVSHSVVQDLCPLIREDNFNIFGFLIECGCSLYYQIANTMTMPNILWEDDLCTSMIFEGCCLTIAGLQKFYLNVIKETKELLYNNILCGAPLSDVHQQEIFDDITCTTPGSLTPGTLSIIIPNSYWNY